MSKLGQRDHIDPKKKNISDILGNYSISHFNFHIDPKGVENSTFIIKAKDGKYALRVYRQNRRSVNEILLEIDYVNFLLKNGIPVPGTVKNNKGEYLTKTRIRNKIWKSILMDFIGGKHPKKYPRGLLIKLAKLQAKMHKLAEKFSSQYSKFLKTCDTSEKVKNFLYTDLLSVDRINLKKIKKESVRSFINNARLFDFSVTGLPIAIVQKDIHGANLLIKGNEIRGILDFDDLFHGPVVSALGFILWDIYVKNRSIKDLYLYIKTYDSVRKLKRDEKKSLKDFVLLRNYVMGTVEFLVGGENSRGKFMFSNKRYSEFEDTIKDLDFNL